jgi:hypothetical protein
MRLVETACLIRLTSVGKRVLGDVVSTTEKGSFEAFVEDEDQRGIWLSPRGQEESRGRTLLVKWEYIATVEVIKEAGSS